MLVLWGPLLLEAPWPWLDLRHQGAHVFGAMLGLLGAMLGPSWAYVRPMLGNFWALFFALKITARRSWAWKGLSWVHVGLM